MQGLLDDGGSVGRNDDYERREINIVVGLGHNDDEGTRHVMPSVEINTPVGPVDGGTCSSLGHVPTAKLPHSQCAALGLESTDVSSYTHDTTSVSGAFNFNAGSEVGSTRKLVKIKRKGGPRSNAKALTQQNVCSSTHNVPLSDPLSKRKLWDTDTEMVDYEGEQKISCSGTGILVFSDDKVAEVGGAQPREQP